jgi:hypothetical protein
VIHATVIGEHLAEYPPYGWFFLAVTLFQVTWGVVVLITPTRTWLAFGIVSNSALLVIWLWSRTSGLPIGPDPGMAEAIGLPDVVCCLYEILLVATAVATLSVRPLARREGGRAIALTVVLLAIATALVISAPRPVADHAGGMRSMAMGRAGADRAIVAVAGSPTHPASRR